MFDTQDECLNAFEKLGFPPIFSEMWKGGGSDRFKRQYDVPVRFFQIKDILKENNLLPLRFLPMLEMNREVIYGFDMDSEKFVEYYYSDSEIFVIGDNYQQFLGAIFVDLGYAGLESLVQEVGDSFEFKYLPELYVFLQQDDDENALDSKMRFILNLH
ncbi:hypothetical protein [Undibacterium sp. TC9W]|uniref:hypothetical protein n=1 Tax=Undibacterium sp. TC9W TaxID=3413053 RepID=UPI003BF0F060